MTDVTEASVVGSSATSATSATRPEGEHDAAAAAAAKELVVAVSEEQRAGLPVIRSLAMLAPDRFSDSRRSSGAYTITRGSVDLTAYGLRYFPFSRSHFLLYEVVSVPRCMLRCNHRKLLDVLFKPMGVVGWCRSSWGDAQQLQMQTDADAELLVPRDLIHAP